ncbi:MAG TPA: PQQ-binding-like beta-propeller repeat protein [Vicinamibacterales bacterium]|nr:PQQ-binding-like beta-propeller repeat protein [Vicinamibacterales bacterium]
MAPIARTALVGAALCCAAPGRLGTGEIEATAGRTGRPAVASAPPAALREARAIWHVPAEGWGRPAASGGTVWCLSKRGEVLALEADTGRRRWSQRIAPPTRAVRGSTVVHAGELIVTADEDLVALEAASGRVCWRFAPSNGDTLGPYLGAAAQELVFAGSKGGGLYAVDLASGTLRWSVPAAAARRTTVFAPVLDGDVVVAGYTTFGPPHRGGVILVDARTGHVRWRRAFTHLHTSSTTGNRPEGRDARADLEHAPSDTTATGVAWAGGPIVLDDAIVVAASTGELYVMAREDGALRWVVPALPRPPIASSFDFRPLARSEKTLLVGSLTGRLVAYDLALRRERWTYALPGGGSVALSLVSEAGTVYVPYAGGRLVAVDVTTGAERWRTRPQDGRFVWSPAVEKGRVYVAGSNGFFAFRS